MLNLRSKAAKLSIQYCEYFFLGVYGYFSNISLTTSGDITFDTFYTLIRDLSDIFTKHTLFRFNKLSDLVVYDRPQYRMRFLLNYVFSLELKFLTLLLFVLTIFVCDIKHQSISGHIAFVDIIVSYMLNL